MKKATYTVTATTGFAQLAALCVYIIQSYGSDVSVAYGGTITSIQRSHKGLMAFMDLGIQPGDSFCIRAEGVDESEVIHAMNEYLGASGKLYVHYGSFLCSR